MAVNEMAMPKTIPMSRRQQPADEDEKPMSPVSRLIGVCLRQVDGLSRARLGTGRGDMLGNFSS